MQNDRSGDALRAFVAPELAVTESSAGTARVDSNPDALAALIVALGDPDANVRMDAVSDLGLSSDRRAESLLAVTAMQDPMPQVRVEALHALETRRGESQPDVFRYALDDPDEDVRKTAAGALEELRSEAPDDAE